MPNSKEITIYDIARKLNISAATVSRGLKDHPAINKKTKLKINEVAREMGYRTNTFASSLRTKKTHTLGIIVPRLNSHFMSEVLAGMEDAASRGNYNLIITQSLENVSKEIKNAETMFNKRVDGLLVSLAYNTENILHFEPFFKKGIPVIFFDRVFEHQDSLCILIDNFKAAYTATKHLIEQGCNRIMHIGGNRHRNVYEDRFRGYKQALEDARIPFEENLHLISTLNEKAGLDAAEYILKMGHQRPDGLFVANDTTAVHCMKKLKEEGIRIPQDIAIVGFNNDPISRVIEPNLTTVNYSGYELGETAVNSLLQQLNGKTNLKITNAIILRSELIIRASSIKKDTR